MSKTSKRAAMAVVAVGLLTTTAFVNINANEVYDDSNIGISSALDRYVDSVQDEQDLLNQSLMAYKATEEKATEEIVDSASVKEGVFTDKTDDASSDLEGTGLSDSSEGADQDADSSEETTTQEEVKEVVATSKYPQFENRCLTTVADHVNIRAEASEDSDLVGTLSAGGIALVKEKGDTWTYIASGSCKGYIKNEFLAYGDDAGLFAEKNLNKLATITTTTLRVRESADESSACITTIPEGESYAIEAVEGDWMKIEVDDGTYGYISSQYADVTFQVVRAVSVEEAEAAKKAAEAQAELELQEKQLAEAEAKREAERQTQAETQAPTETQDQTTQTVEVPTDKVVSGTGSEVASYALQFVGNPYVWGGTSLTNGADCSGFVLSVYAHFGYSLPHSSRAQANCGKEVSLSELQPGDLLFYASGGVIEHVTMYIGGGQVVHASSAKTGIKVSQYNYRTPAKAVRILK